MKLVEDVTGEEVSKMHLRSVLVGILDPVTRQHTAMNHSKSYEALKKIVQEFASKSTTGQEVMQIGRFEAGTTAPTTDWTPSVADTSEDSWKEYGAINATGSQQCRTYKGYGHVSRNCPNGKGSATSARAMAHTNEVRATTTGTRAATTGCARKVERPTVRALIVSSRCTREVTASLDGKKAVMASATLAVEIIFHEIAPKGKEKEDSRHWKLGRLGKSRHW